MKIEDLHQIEFSMQNRVNSNELKSINLQQVIYYITEDAEVQANIKSLHNFIVQQGLDMNNAEHKKKYQSKKVELLKAFIPTGIFNKPVNSELYRYSQIVQLDFDNLTDLQLEKLMEFVKNEKSVVFSFISPGGRGRKIFHAVKPVNGIFEDGDESIAEWELRQMFHTSAFQKLQAIYNQSGVGVGFDAQIHDLSRRCYFSHDANCYLNEEIVPFEIAFDQTDAIASKKKENRQESLISYYLDYVRSQDYLKQNEKLNYAVLNDLLEWLRKNQKSITGSYNEWIRVIFALKANLPEDAALYYAKQFSQLDKNYNEVEFLDKFNQTIENSKAPTIATLVYFAKLSGYEMCFEIKKKTGSNFTLEYFIRDLSAFNYRVRYNTFIDILEVANKGSKEWRRLVDSDLSKLRTAVFNYSMKIDDIHHTLNTVAPKYDPVEVLMGSIPVWDKVDRLNLLAQTLNPSDLTVAEMMIKKWMIGVLANINNPKNYNENVLILQGDQGKGKTRWVRGVIESLLNHAELQTNRYFVEKAIDPTNKDDLKLMCTSFVIFYDELSGIVNSKADIQAFKNLTSSQGHLIRKAYDRNETEYLRKASIIATVNDKQFLRDVENRRFWVIACTDINSPNMIDLVQVWAQVKCLYQEGYKPYLNSVELKMLKEYLRQFEAKSTEEELILSYVHKGSTKLTATEIKSIIEKSENTKLSMTAPNFGKILSKYFDGSRTNRGTVYSVSIWYEGGVKEVVQNENKELEKVANSFTGSEPIVVPNELLHQPNSHNISREDGKFTQGQVGLNPEYR